MIAVIFELRAKEGREDAYYDLAAELRPQLERVDGFISVERFRSLTDSDKLLSLSFFEDEVAVREWRTLPAHRAAQAAGRRSIFADYRLRVAKVLRDYGMTERGQAPDDSRKSHG